MPGGGESAEDRLWHSVGVFFRAGQGGGRKGRRVAWRRAWPGSRIRRIPGGKRNMPAGCSRSMKRPCAPRERGVRKPHCARAAAALALARGISYCPFLRNAARQKTAWGRTQNAPQRRLRFFGPCRTVFFIVKCCNV